MDGNGPVIPVCLLDEVVETYGAAPKWRWGEAVKFFSQRVEQLSSNLILRRGDALTTLRALIAETGANRVVWGRQYDRLAKARDTKVKAALKSDGIEAISVRNHLLFEPWDIETKTGGPYRVYTPFKNTCLARDVYDANIPAPSNLVPLDVWPKSETLSDWGLDRAMNRGAAVVANYSAIGEQAALDRLDTFSEKIADYVAARDVPSIVGTSRLSENLAWGEISPLTIWNTVRQSRSANTKGAQVYLSEILWREFAYHLTHHYPNITDANWRDEWNAFPWRSDNDDAERWRRGMTGIPFVDAAMRELYTTGTMHNRLRMLTASLLTKHSLNASVIGIQPLMRWDGSGPLGQVQTHRPSSVSLTQRLNEINSIRKILMFQTGSRKCQSTNRRMLETFTPLFPLLGT